MAETDAPAAAPNSEKAEKIIPRIIEQEMSKSYLSYAMSVIVGRALPDVRDGLKPVHRRILYGMWELGLQHNKPFKKSARIVGDILGKYHPHGDMAVYDALVRMAQDFSMRYPLVKGQGNFGSVDGDNPAAMRYCVTGDTLIVTEKGLLPIGKIAENENINLHVLSKDRKTHRASKWFDSGEHPTLRITTNKGYAIQGSFNHPILVLTTAFGRPTFSWKRLDEMHIGDVVVLDRSDALWPGNELDVAPYYPKQRTSRTVKTQLPESMTPDLGFILGALCSEGSISENKIEFCNTDEKFVAEFEAAWKRTFPGSTLHKFRRQASSYGKKVYTRLECHFRYTLDFLKNLGLSPVKSAQKKVPETIFLSPKQVAAAFLRSYFEGDGSISYAPKMVELSCCSVSEQLLREIQFLLLRFGIDASKRFDRQRKIHKLYIRGRRSILKFYKEIGFFSERKNKKLEFVILHYKKDYSRFDCVPFISDYIRSLTKDGFVEKMNFDRYGNMQDYYQTVSTIVRKKTGIDVQRMFEYLLTYDYLFERVVSVEQAGVHRVYSIKVESTCHSFIANGFINHNTEAKLAKMAEELLIDIDKETVDFSPNFDGTLKEPVVMPGRLPNLLINGSSGIAVGMATNIPPHNIKEVCEGIIAVIDNPAIEPKALLQYVKGPDFPTGAIIQGSQGIVDAYMTGRGKVLVKAKAAVEQHKGKDRIIVTEIPYMVNKAQMIEHIADLVRDGRIKGIADIRDESDEDVRVVIELKSDAQGEVILNQLYTYSRLSETFSINMLALVDNEPKVLGLKQVMQHHITHRQHVVRRRTQFELTKAEQRVHILEGLIIALNNIDEVVRKIKQSQDAAAAETMLKADYQLSEAQAKAILDMKLQRLASLEQEKIRTEHQELLKVIARLKEILASEQKILEIIRGELLETMEQFADARKTLIEDGVRKELVTEDLIQEQEVVITISHAGYIKRQPVEVYKTQGRGGKGIIAAGTKDEDFVESIFVTSTHSYVLFFTDKGKVYWLKVYEIPEASRQAKGKAIVNLVKLEAGEKIEASIPVKEFDDKHYLVLATKKGIIKKTNLSEYSRPRQTGIIAITLEQGDSLVNALLTDGHQQIILTTQNGMAVKFHEQQARPIGRAAMGVRGISLKDKDEVVDVVTGDDAKSLLTVTEHGYGKRSRISEYRQIARGGIGVINIQCTERNGKVIATKTVDEEDEVMLISQKGIVIRLPAKDISVIGRNTQGVTLMKLGQGDRVMDCTKIVG